MTALPAAVGVAVIGNSRVRAAASAGNDGQPRVRVHQFDQRIDTGANMLFQWSVRYGR